MCACTHVYVMVRVQRSENSKRSLLSPFTFTRVQGITFRWPGFEASTFPREPSHWPQGRGFIEDVRCFSLCQVSKYESSWGSILCDAPNEKSITAFHFMSTSHDICLLLCLSCLLGVKCQDPKPYKCVKYSCELRAFESISDQVFLVKI